MGRELKQDIEDAAYNATQRSKRREAVGSGIALAGIIAAIFVGGIAGSAMVGLVIAILAIGYGAYYTYH